MLFIATFALVQRLLAAKRDLRLEKELAAAIDRLVHHSVTIEMTGGSIRAEAAENARKEMPATTTPTTTTTTKTATKEADGAMSLS